MSASSSPPSQTTSATSSSAPPSSIEPILPPVGPVDCKLPSIDDSDVNPRKLAKWKSGVDELPDDPELREVLAELHTNLVSLVDVFKKVDLESKPLLQNETSDMVVECSTIARACEQFLEAEHPNAPKS